VRKVVWSQAALDDINDVVAYIAADNPGAALKVLDRLEEACEKLGAMAIGRRGRVSGTYEKLVRNLPYIIAYALRPQPVGGELVVILRIIHTARDWPGESWPKRSGRSPSR
jgi:plasmid stabilization system protein ParE